MKNFFIKNLFYIIYTFIFLLISITILRSFNDSIIRAFIFTTFLLILIYMIGTILSKIIFYIRIKNKKLNKLNYETFESKDLYKSITISIITLFIYFSTIYIIIYFNSPKLFGKLPLTTGIINSIMYISKIYFISLPLYAFELTFIVYCNFLKQIRLPIIQKIIKALIFFILSLILTNIYKLNGFLYSKLITDFILFIYILNNLRKIIILCKKQMKKYS